MGINVKCPNGHTTRVKNSFAGKTGFCPVCKARMVVPDAPRSEMSEDSILGIIGTSPPKPPANAGSSQEESVDPLEQFVTAKAARKKCQKCRREIDNETHICPHCHTYIAGLEDFQ